MINADRIDSYANFLPALRLTMSAKRAERGRGFDMLAAMGPEAGHVAMNLLQSLVLRLASATGWTVDEVLDDLTVNETMIDPEEETDD